MIEEIYKKEFEHTVRRYKKEIDFWLQGGSLQFVFWIDKFHSEEFIHALESEKYVIESTAMKVGEFPYQFLIQILLTRKFENINISLANPDILNNSNPGYESKKQTMPKEKMTKQEKKALKKTVKFWNYFCTLPKDHPSDQSDVCFHIRAIQSLIMSRSEYRKRKI